MSDTCVFSFVGIVYPGAPGPHRSAGLRRNSPLPTVESGEPGSCFLRSMGISLDELFIHPVASLHNTLFADYSR